MFIITIASSLEMSELTKKTIIKDEKVISGCLFITGILNGKEILIVKTGVGTKKAASAARLILKSYKPHLVLSVGAAGAVDPALNTGDIVVINKIFQKNGDCFICDDQISRNAFQLIRESGYSVSRGDCMTINRFIHSRQEKKRIFSMSAPSIVDMESAAEARVFSSSNISFLNVRVISDTARSDTFNINNYILQKKKISGTFNLYFYFLKKPSEILKSIRLRKDLRKTSKIILSVVEILAEGL
jgi:adenosylhomocysteine nucleosidase